jgi:hypothetical protein
MNVERDNRFFPLGFPSATIIRCAINSLHTSGFYDYMCIDRQLS